MKMHILLLRGVVELEARDGHPTKGMRRLAKLAQWYCDQHAEELCAVQRLFLDNTYTHTYHVEARLAAGNAHHEQWLADSLAETLARFVDGDSVFVTLHIVQKSNSDHWNIADWPTILRVVKA
jgi:hypothetical protein